MTQTEQTTFAKNCVPSVKHIQDTLKMFRTANFKDEIICEVKISNKDFERKFNITWQEMGGEEFIDLIISNEERFKKYVFIPNTKELKQLREVCLEFMETGNVDYILY